MDCKLILKDFTKALKQFKNALDTPHENDLIRAGCIQYFEFCFELAWKSIKIFCEEQGLSDGNSPKKALKQAFALKWIGKEEIWLEMLSARNQMAHTYDSKDALQIYYRLSFFVPELSKLAKKLQQELTEE